MRPSTILVMSVLAVSSVLALPQQRPAQFRQAAPDRLRSIMTGVMGNANMVYNRISNGISRTFGAARNDGQRQFRQEHGAPARAEEGAPNAPGPNRRPIQRAPTLMQRVQSMFGGMNSMFRNVFRRSGGPGPAVRRNPQHFAQEQKQPQGHGQQGGHHQQSHHQEEHSQDFPQSHSSIRHH